MDFACVTQDSPLRSPAWRFLRARSLIERGKRISPKHDDEWIQRIKRFLVATEKAAPDPGKSRRRPQHDHDLAAALAVYDGPAAARGLLEAYLLTDAPLDYVAGRCGLSLAVVEAYEALLFNVRDRLQARDWVQCQAIGSATGYQAEYPARLWRAFAYAGGPIILESVVAITTGQPLLAPPGLSPDEASAWIAVTEFQVRLSIAMMLAVTSDELAALVRLVTKGPKEPSGECQKAIMDFLAISKGSASARRSLPQQPAELHQLMSAMSPLFNIRKARRPARPSKKPPHSRRLVQKRSAANFDVVIDTTRPSLPC